MWYEVNSLSIMVINGAGNETVFIVFQKIWLILDLRYQLEFLRLLLSSRIARLLAILTLLSLSLPA